MPRRSLDSLLRLRRQEQAEAERHYADALASEAAAARGVATAEDTLVREQRKAADPDCDDALVESFARWLPRGREALGRARDLAREATLDASYARSALAMARASVRAVETILAEQERHAGIRRARREQAQIDDLRRVEDDFV